MTKRPYPDTASVDWPAKIDMIVFDFDGVMTDNSVYVDADGNETVRCHRGDGWGIARLHDLNVRMLVLSTEDHPVLRARCAKLRLGCHHGIADKGAALSTLLADAGIDPAHVAYVGNDENDLTCLETVGLPVVVADAHPAVMAHAALVLERNGGDGAVREFCDLIRAHLAKKGNV